MQYKNILQVDDDEEDCEMFYEALRKVSPANYTSINDSIDALKKLESGKIIPDVIVLDINMPIVNGMEFLVRLKENDTLKIIPVIIFSTSTLVQTKRTAISLGAADYIVKPSNFSELKNTLRSIFT
jgi:DNA-binding response OmpR family regulator